MPIEYTWRKRLCGLSFCCSWRWTFPMHEPRKVEELLTKHPENKKITNNFSFGISSIDLNKITIKWRCRGQRNYWVHVRILHNKSYIDYHARPSSICVGGSSRLLHKYQIWPFLIFNHWFVWPVGSLPQTESTFSSTTFSFVFIVTLSIWRVPIKWQQHNCITNTWRLHRFKRDVKMYLSTLKSLHYR